MPPLTLEELPFGFKVEARVEAVPAARRRVAAVAGGLGLALSSQTVEDLELLAGEVIANAITHTDGTCVVCLRWTGTRLRVEVTDAEQATGAAISAGPSEESGRGLFLVDALAASWGTQLTHAGKIVWFEVSAGSPPDDWNSPSEQPCQLGAMRDATVRDASATQCAMEVAHRTPSHLGAPIGLKLSHPTG
ncbi:ATP-binding protein [Streptomyces sp. NPDC086182]|uniref:ATP-binding protein n=1 Tax=Streptomyces sp. NPDC086182 TaxID=3155058 RepID=UPI0034484DE9